MNFCWCTVRVNNMEESINFYQEIVNLSIKKRYVSETGKEICFLGDGETQIELVCDPKSKIVNNCEGISLGFEVNSVEEMINFIIERGYEVDKGPFQPNPNIKFFYIKDPDGFKIQFVENI